MALCRRCWTLNNFWLLFLSWGFSKGLSEDINWENWSTKKSFVIKHYQRLIRAESKFFCGRKDQKVTRKFFKVSNWFLPQTDQIRSGRVFNQTSKLKTTEKVTLCLNLEGLLAFFKLLNETFSFYEFSWSWPREENYQRQMSVRLSLSIW